MCERCGELEERVAWLESELGLRDEAERLDRVRALLRSDMRHGRQAAFLVSALYSAGGRAVTKLQLLDAMPSPGGRDDRDLKLVDVVVCAARKALGKDAIETIWGRGYRLSPEGLEQLRAVFEPQKAAA